MDDRTIPRDHPATLAKRDTKPANPAPPAPDRSEPPQGYFVDGRSAPFGAYADTPQGDASHGEHETREGAVAACWVHFDRITAPAEARARSLEGVLADERRKRECDLREAWDAQAKALDDRDDAQRTAEEAQASADAMEARALAAEREATAWKEQVHAAEERAAHHVGGARAAVEALSDVADKYERALTRLDHQGRELAAETWRREQAEGAIEAARQAGYEEGRRAVGRELESGLVMLGMRPGSVYPLDLVAAVGLALGERRREGWEACAAAVREHMPAAGYENVGLLDVHRIVNSPAPTPKGPELGVDKPVRYPWHMAHPTRGDRYPLCGAGGPGLNITRVRSYVLCKRCIKLMPEPTEAAPKGGTPKDLRETIDSTRGATQEPCNASSTRFGASSPSPAPSTSSPAPGTTRSPTSRSTPTSASPRAASEPSGRSSPASRAAASTIPSGSSDTPSPSATSTAPDGATPDHSAAMGAPEPPAAPLPSPPQHEGEPTDDEQRTYALDLLAWALGRASRGLPESDGQRLRWALRWVRDDAPPAPAAAPLPDACTPSTFPSGAMERMSRRGDTEDGAAAAPHGAGPGSAWEREAQQQATADLADALGEIEELRDRIKTMQWGRDECEAHNLALIDELRRERELRAKAMHGCQRLRERLAATSLTPPTSAPQGAGPGSKEIDLREASSALLALAERVGQEHRDATAAEVAHALGRLAAPSAPQAETPDDRERAIVRRLAGEWGEIEVGPTESIDDVVSHIHGAGTMFMRMVNEVADFRDWALRLAGLKLTDWRSDEATRAAVEKLLAALPSAPQGGPMIEWAKTVDNQVSQQWDASLGDVRLSVWTHDRDRMDEAAALGGPWWAKAEIPPRRLPSLEAGQQVAEAQARRLAATPPHGERPEPASPLQGSAEPDESDIATCDGCKLPKPLDRVHFGDGAITCDECSAKLAAEESSPITWEREEGIDGGDVWMAGHRGWTLSVQGGLVEVTDPSWEWEVVRDEPFAERIAGTVAVHMDPEDDGWEAAANGAVALAKARAEAVARALAEPHQGSGTAEPVVLFDEDGAATAVVADGLTGREPTYVPKVGDPVEVRPTSDEPPPDPSAFLRGEAAKAEARALLAGDEPGEVE